MPPPSTSLPHLRNAVRAALPGRPVLLEGLRGASVAFVLASLRHGEAISGPLLVVSPTDDEARRLRRDLRFFGVPARLLPAWDVKPYAGYSPSADVSRLRLAALFALATEPDAVVVAPAEALLKRVVPPALVATLGEVVRVGQEVDREALVGRLVERGYFRTDLCTEPGTFAVRGGILDVFAPSDELPLRIDFWGDEIESIRTFDPRSARSREARPEALLLAIREELVSDAALAALPPRLKALADARGVLPRRRVQIQDELRERRLVQEIELFLPLLCEEPLVSVFDFLRGVPGALLVLADPAAAAATAAAAHEELGQRYEREDGAGRLLPPPEALWLNPSELADAAATLPSLLLPDIIEAHAGVPLRLCAPDHGGLRTEILARRSDPEGMLGPLVDRARRWLADRILVLIVAGSRRRLRQIAELLAPYDLPLREHEAPPSLAALLDPGSSLHTPRALHLVPGDLERGFALLPTLVVVAESEIFGLPKAPRRRLSAPGTESIGSFAQLTRGDVVVHSVHGLGRFVGMEKLRLDPSALDVLADVRERASDPDYAPGSRGKAGAGRGSENDYLLLEYRDGDRLYLPVHKLDQLCRYVAPGGGKPVLDKLGGTTWVKRKQKATEAVQAVARELLELYARRRLAESRPFPPPERLYHEFVAGFPYEETPDQQAAIEAVLHDMSTPLPMDRLICGDVGFGKTEVALRAAFRAVEAGRQVAVLVPTTILALQHFQAFSARMAAFPVRVEMLSRFRTAAEQKEVVRGLKEGFVDVVIGTHRLVSADIQFRDLGLMVVDEEHRFGVKHKERLKELRANVDVLTMTATPIPRTLHLALSGVREVSLITTAPEGRRPVRTQVARFSPRRIQDEIRRELDRGGQVFFVHNRVRSIEKMAEFLRKLVPEASIRVGHGQMAEEELEDLMISFFRREFDVLLCTTIIESGIDLPTANTMIIHRADLLGLAQLHQLRGRVGRAGEQGYCTLVVPPGRTLRAEALTRLKVMQDHSELGSGHHIAQRDLELRGAGNMLGKRQAGHVADVGLATYMELLEAAVKQLAGGHADRGPDTDVELRADAYIPADYVPDEAERLLEYKALADARTQEELTRLLQELTVTFGPPPPEVVRFEQLLEVKVRARALGIARVRAVRGGRLQLDIDAGTSLDPGRLLPLVAAMKRVMTLRPDGSLIVTLDEDQKRDLVAAAAWVLSLLQGCVAPLPPSVAAEPRRAP